MRILLIADAYAPAQTSCAIQMRDLVRELVRDGHQPTVVVPDPALGERWQSDELDGAQVVRVRSLRSKDVGRVRRVLAEVLMPFTLMRALRAQEFCRERWDGVVWYSPTIFFGPLVRWVKRAHGCRSYLILRDLFPDWAVDAGVMRKGAAYRFFKQVERYQYASADVIGVQTAANLPLVQKDCRGAGSRLEVLNNWLSPPQAVSSGAALPERFKGRTVLVYAGNMGVAQGMDCLLDLAERFRSRGDVGFLFVGRGSEVPRLRELTRARQLENTAFLDEIPSGDVPALLAECDIGLIALDPRHRTHNVPGKLLSYLHAGLPVLARINAGNDLEALIDREAIGRACTGDSGEMLFRLAEELINQPELRAELGRNGRSVVKAHFSTRVVAAQILEGLAG